MAVSSWLVSTSAEALAGIVRPSVRQQAINVGVRTAWASITVVLLSQSSMNSDAAAAQASDKIPAWVWRISGIVILGAIMSILDTTIVNVALESLGRELQTTIADIQWVVTVYLLSLYTFIPISVYEGRLFVSQWVLYVSLVLLNN